jgi:hypothetical protein
MEEARLLGTVSPAGLEAPDGVGEPNAGVHDLAGHFRGVFGRLGGPELLATSTGDGGDCATRSPGPMSARPRRKDRGPRRYAVMAPPV